MKFLGIIILMAAAAYIGIAASQRLSGRVKELRAAILMLDRIKTSLLFNASKTADLINETANMPEFKDLKFLSLCVKKLKTNPDFSQVWRSSLEDMPGNLNDADVRLLSCAGGIIGSIDAQSQAMELERLSSFLGKNMEAAAAEHKTKGRLYTTLGILSGAGIAIILM